MSVYRLRILTMVQLAGLTASTADLRGQPGVALTTHLSPQLQSISASAQNPPTPPLSLATSCAPASHNTQTIGFSSANIFRASKDHSTAESSPSRFREPVPVQASSVRLHVTLSDTTEPAVLHSVSRARLQVQGEQPIRLHWMRRPSPPDMQPSGAAELQSPSFGSRLRQRLATLLWREGAQQVPTYAADPKQECMLVADVSVELARCLASASLTVELRSDFQVVQLPLKLAWQHLWVVGEPAAVVGKLLTSLMMPSPAVQSPSSGTKAAEHTCSNSSAMSPLRSELVRSLVLLKTSLPLALLSFCSRRWASLESSGVLAIGLRFDWFDGDASRMLRHLQERLACPRLPWRQRLTDAARHCMAMVEFRHMPRTKRLPDLLLLLQQPDCDEARLEQTTASCIAAANSGIGVVICAIPDHLELLRDRFANETAVALVALTFNGEALHEMCVQSIQSSLYQLAAMKHSNLVSPLQLANVHRSQL